MGQWFCDAASIYNRWALQQRWKSPGIPTKNNTEVSASILHPGTVFIWITPPNPLSNDMTQWVTIPQILLREKHWVFGSDWDAVGKKEFQMNFRGTEYWNDYSTLRLHIYREYMWLRENYLDTLTAKAFLCSVHYSLVGKKNHWFQPKTLADLQPINTDASCLTDPDHVGLKFTLNSPERV